MLSVKWQSKNSIPALQNSCTPTDYVSQGRCRASPEWTAEGGCPYVTLGWVGVVIAPSAADLTSAAYLAKTPVLYFAAGAFHSASRRAISASEISSSSLRILVSMVILSPSRIAAIGPPSAASGATWPTIRPRVALLKR